jgi:hypothetical protein
LEAQAAGDVNKLNWKHGWLIDTPGVTVENQRYFSEPPQLTETLLHVLPQILLDHILVSLHFVCNRLHTCEQLHCLALLHNEAIEYL